MAEHLGYEKHDSAGHHRGNTRSGKSQKTLTDDFGELALETPRRPPSDVRSQARGQGADPLGGLRRQDHLHVRAGHDDARDPGPLGRNVRDRSFSDADFQRGRRGGGSSEALAGAAAARDLSDRVFGCPHRESARRTARAKQSHLPGAGGEPGGPGRKCWGCGWRRQKARSSGCDVPPFAVPISL
jgi:hypothetical protein